MQQTYTDKELQAEIKRLMEQYEHPAANNAPILMIDIIEQQRARNMGYPKWMYHEKLEPQHVKNKDQERAIAAQGYKTYYIKQEYPAWVFRRNMDPKFEDPTPAGAPGGFVEQRLVRNAAQFDALAKEARSKTAVGDWCRELADIAPIEEGPSEDPKVTIARLQGKLSALEAAPEEAPRRGRPPKSE